MPRLYVEIMVGVQNEIYRPARNVALNFSAVL